MIDDLHGMDSGLQAWKGCWNLGLAVVSDILRSYEMLVWLHVGKACE